MSFSAAISKSSPASSRVSKMSCTFGPAQCKNKAQFPCFILYVHCQRVNFNSFHVFSEARTNRSWIRVGVECFVIQVCIETSHLQEIEELLVANVKSRIELNKRLHYTPLVPLIVLLLVRSLLSYVQIKSLFS